MTRLFYWLQTWLIVILIGMSTGITAGFIDIAAEWLSDIKDGYCKEGIYLNKNFCCWDIQGEAECVDWVGWGSHSTGFLQSMQAFLVYLYFAVLFAFCSAILVLNYAPYAAGSGISRLK